MYLFGLSNPGKTSFIKDELSSECVTRKLYTICSSITKTEYSGITEDNMYMLTKAKRRRKDLSLLILTDIHYACVWDEFQAQSSIETFK